jgi:hypothetical protein
MTDGMVDFSYRVETPFGRTDCRIDEIPPWLKEVGGFS